MAEQLHTPAGRSGLEQRTLKGVVWSVVGTWSEQAIALLVLVALARLLAPADFGAVALAGAILFLPHLIVQQTFVHPLVQRPHVAAAQWNAAFWMALALGAAAMLAIYAAAGLLAAALGQPLVEPLLRWLAPMTLASSAVVVPIARLTRELRFRAMAVRASLAAALAGAVAIALALAGLGVWALVAQQLVYGAANLIMYWLLCPWRPRLGMALSDGSDLFHFGKFVSGQGLLGVITERADVVVIGYLLGAASVGMYNVGYRMLRLLINGVTGSIVRVLLPSYARLQAEPARLVAALYRSLRFACLVNFPLFVGLACVATEAVHVVLGERWLPAADVVRFLALAGAVQSVGFLNTTTIVACGHPDKAFRLAIAHAAVNLTAVVVGARWGIVGVAVALAAGSLVREPLTLWSLRRVVAVPLAGYGRAMLPAVAASGAMAAVVVLVRELAGDALSVYAALPLYVAAGAAAYALFLAVFVPALTREAFVLTRRALERRATA